MSFATIAFSIDAMLPALPEIGHALTPQNLNRAQLIVTSFLLGLGLGTLFTGPLSDAFGRRRILLGGYGIYIIGAVLGYLAGSLELMLAARVLQGIGAAGPRVVAVAVVRDIYSGRQMAKLMSFVITVFMLVPVIAPSIGAVIITLSGWRVIFVAFVIFALISSIWFSLRQPETLPVEKRRKFQLGPLWGGVKEVLANRSVRITIAVQALLSGVLYAMLSSAQQVFEITFDQGANFPLWFGAIAIIAGASGLLNAKLVIQLGMVFLVRSALICVMLISFSLLVIIWLDLMPARLYFPGFLVFMTSVFFMIGMTLGNLNAIAMEPMGHIAGMAASIISAIATVIGVVIAVPIGLAFDGTPLPLMIGVFCCVALSLGLMQLIRSDSA
ncbi:MAG TPA: multidrug MFS transporter [Rhodobacteraceae bacterium]|nr:multidrug MFS transporter [Paracoccaceae bacterium]